jgi:hypothetical protein
MSSITVQAGVTGVKTDKDGHVLVSFQLLGKFPMEVAALIECQRIGACLDLEISVEDQQTGEPTHDTKKGRPYRLSYRNG